MIILKSQTQVIPFVQNLLKLSGSALLSFVSKDAFLTTPDIFKPVLRSLEAKPEAVAAVMLAVAVAAQPAAAADADFDVAHLAVAADDAVPHAAAVAEEGSVDETSQDAAAVAVGKPANLAAAVASCADAACLTHQAVASCQPVAEILAAGAMATLRSAAVAAAAVQSGHSAAAAEQSGRSAVAAAVHSGHSAAVAAVHCTHSAAVAAQQQHSVTSPYPHRPAATAHHTASCERASEAAPGPGHTPDAASVATGHRPVQPPAASSAAGSASAAGCGAAAATAAAGGAAAGQV